MKFTVDGGVIAIGWQTDDGFGVHTKNAAGLKLKAEFLSALQSRYEITIKHKVDQFLGMDLIPNVDESLSLRQTNMITKVRIKFGYGDDIVAP